MTLKKIILLSFIGILCFILFSGTFALLQNDNCYRNTLGKVSSNYERIGGWNNFEIKKVTKPYTEISNDNLTTWDAAIYKCISEKMYAPGKDCYANISGAFFPLFPLLWKITSSTPVSISLINYFLFILSIALLASSILKTNTFDTCMIYIILITLPSTIVYYIPYSEALFLFTMTLAAIGILRNNYWLFLTGALLTELVRPAAIFILFAIAFTEILLLLKNKDYKAFIRQLILRTVPFLAGYLTAIFIQYTYSSSWTTLLQAQRSWHYELQPLKGITDWSVEGFGLSTFSVFFICIPSLIFILFLLFRKKTRDDANNIVMLNQDDKTGYLFLVSIFYLTSIFIYTLLTRAGSLNSFFRYTLSTPLFYIVLLTVLNDLLTKPAKKYFYILTGSVALLVLFLATVNYGGDRMNFSFFGLYLLILIFFFLLIKSELGRSIQITIALLLVISSIVWTTYLLNAFLCDAWIFT